MNRKLNADSAATTRKMTITMADPSPKFCPRPACRARLNVKEMRMSVCPTGTEAPATGGPPEVSRKISVKLLKL